MNKKSKYSSGAPGKVRLLGGDWRGRVLEVGDADGLRPTGSRIRETLFNWLMPYIHGARCLDMYAGTGALGLEALSRGATFVQFCETNRDTAAVLQQNLKKLQTPSTHFKVQAGDAITGLASVSKSFNIAFIDPPFEQNLWQSSIDVLALSTHLADDALIYVESPKGTKFTVPSGWREHRTLNAGAINATLYARF